MENLFYCRVFPQFPKVIAGYCDIKVNVTTLVHSFWNEMTTDNIGTEVVWLGVGTVGQWQRPSAVKRLGIRAADEPEAGSDMVDDVTKCQPQHKRLSDVCIVWVVRKFFVFLRKPVQSSTNPYSIVASSVCLPGNVCRVMFITLFLLFFCVNDLCFRH